MGVKHLPSDNDHSTANNEEWLLLLLWEFQETAGLLTNPKRSIQWQRINRRTMESKLEGTVNYLQFVDCSIDYLGLPSIY